MVFYTAVHFRCVAKVDFGNKVVVVGSHENLGSWDAKRGHALVMSSTVEDVWNSSYPVYLPLKEHVEYRYAILDQKGLFLRWNDAAVRHVEPTGNEMIVEDDEGYYRSECSSYPKSYTSPKFNGKLDGAVEDMDFVNMMNEQELNTDDKVYFVTTRLPVQLFRRLDGTFGIRDSNTPLTAMLWELRNRFRNKMRFVGACSVTYESETDLNAAGVKTEATLGSSLVTDSLQQSTNSVDGVDGTHRGKCADVNDADFSEQEQEQIRQLLLSHDCIPVFVPSAEVNRSMKFCKKYMWNLFYNIGLWDINEQNEFDWELWQAFCRVNRMYALAVAQYLGRNDFTWVHDYKLLMVPHYLTRKCKTANIGLFMHALFPSYTLFACLAVREEILRSMLCADLIGFHYFEFARQFLTSCGRILGLEYNFSTEGMMGIEYNGRHVMIRMSEVHVQCDLLEMRMGPNTRVPELARRMREKWPDRFIVASVDRDTLLSGLLLKFKALRKFLQNYPYARGKILLVQHICSLDTLWQGHSDVTAKLRSLANEINNEYKTEHVVVVMNASSDEKHAMFMAADCFMDTSIRGGINLCAFEYLYCRKGKPASAIISEFTGLSKTLLSAIKVNPWHTDSLMEAMDTSMSLSPEEATEFCKKDVAYIEKNDTTTWVNDFVRELYYSRKKHDMLHTSWGFGKTYKTLSFSSNFLPLDFDMVLSRFEGSRRKLLFMDCEGTLSRNPFDVESKSYNQTNIETKCMPLQVNLDNLRKLSRDKNTVVVLISCRTKEVMDNWFGGIPNLGLCSERGYYFKLPYVFGHRWQTQDHASNYANNTNHASGAAEAASDEWKVVALRPVQQYVQRTPGSYFESKDSCLVFQYQNSDKEFGAIQAKELSTTLSDLMEGFPVDVHRGKGFLEVRLKGVNKGNALLHVVNKYASLYGDFDFVLCLGDDRSDEEMFRALETLKASRPAPRDAHAAPGGREEGARDSYISCIVGKRPSKANFYVNDYMEVADLLTALANTVE